MAKAKAVKINRTRDQIKRCVEAALRTHFPIDTIDISDGYKDNIHVLVVSNRFDLMTEKQKQDLLWEIINETQLSQREKGMISLLYPLGVSELR